MSQSKALEALFPGPRRMVLCAMFHEPDRWWSLPELAGRAGIHTSSLRSHLTQLREGGLIRQKADGGRPWFQADASSPVFADVHSIVAKLTAQTNGAETILIVEDQPATAQITRILLESWGYHVLEAHGGPEALGVFEEHREAIQLLLTDVIMPGVGGVQLADELTRRKPELRIIYMSGYPNEQLDGSTAFLSKPFNPAGLARIVRKELDRRTRKMKSP